MVKNNLLEYSNRLNYLQTEGTLSELLDFLGMQYFDGSRNKHNEHRDVYEFIKEGTMAIEVILTESKVRIWSTLSAWHSLRHKDSFWYILFGKYPELVKRLVDLLNRKYSYLGSLSYEIRLDGQFKEFKKDYLDLDDSEL